MNKHAEFLEIICCIARDAGEIVLLAENDRASLGIESKEGSANFVTLYDKKVQTFLFEKLGKAFPTAIFVGEEDDGGNSHKIYDGLSFIIDPIDGTTNFIRGCLTSTISIALLDHAIPVVGVVYDPYRNEMFTAIKGCGAKCNGKEIHTENNPLCNCIVDFGTSPYYKKSIGEYTFRLAKKFFDVCLDIRRSGSAALDICRVACGRCDIMFEALLSPWDYAAASLILTEAGGKISDFDGNVIDFNEPRSIIACSGKIIHSACVDIIKSVELQKE